MSAGRIDGCMPLKADGRGDAAINAVQVGTMLELQGFYLDGQLEENVEVVQIEDEENDEA